jgi:hypothetical protein
MGTIKIDNGKIYHQQAGKWLEIGDANFAKRILTVYRDKEKHLMRVFDGYGFNKEIIETDRFFDYVALEETDGEQHNVYFIPREEIIQEGKLYQAEGYERQIFLSLAQLETYKMK